VASLRWGLFAAAGALVISAALGVISGVRPLHIFLRSLVFTVLFFGIGFGLRMIINNLFPELLHLDDEPVIGEGNPQAGSRVDVTVDGEFAVPEKYRDSSDPNALGNIEDLVSGAFNPNTASESSHHEGIDGKSRNDYNMQGSSGDAESFHAQEFPSEHGHHADGAFTPSFGDDVSGLPDLDAIGMAFSSGEARSGTAAAQAFTEDAGFMEPVGAMSPYEEAAPAKPAAKAGNKPQQIEGDFNPKELAMGIRTVLSKDK